MFDVKKTSRSETNAETKTYKPKSLLNLPKFSIVTYSDGTTERITGNEAALIAMVAFEEDAER